MTKLLGWNKTEKNTTRGYFLRAPDGLDPWWTITKHNMGYGGFYFTVERGGEHLGQAGTLFLAKQLAEDDAYNLLRNRSLKSNPEPRGPRQRMQANKLQPYSAGGVYVISTKTGNILSGPWLSEAAARAGAHGNRKDTAIVHHEYRGHEIGREGGPYYPKRNPAAGKWVPYSDADASAWAADKSPDKRGSYRLTGTGSALVTVCPIKLHPHTSPTVSYLPGVHLNGRWLNMERAYSTLAAAKKAAEQQYDIQARYEGHKANPKKQFKRDKQWHPAKGNPASLPKQPRGGGVNARGGWRHVPGSGVWLAKYATGPSYQIVHWNDGTSKDPRPHYALEAGRWSKAADSFKGGVNSGVYRTLSEAQHEAGNMRRRWALGRQK